MSKFVLPSSVDLLTIVRLPVLQFEYKNHRILVKLSVDLERDGCIWWEQHLMVDEKAVDIHKLDEGMYDDWCDYSSEPCSSFTDPNFAKLVKKILNKYLKETV